MYRKTPHELPFLVGVQFIPLSPCTLRKAFYFISVRVCDDAVLVVKCGSFCILLEYGNNTNVRNKYVGNKLFLQKK